VSLPYLVSLTHGHGLFKIEVFNDVITVVAGLRHLTRRSFSRDN